MEDSLRSETPTNRVRNNHIAWGEKTMPIESRFIHTPLQSVHSILEFLMSLNKGLTESISSENSNLPNHRSDSFSSCNYEIQDRLRNYADES